MANGISMNAAAAAVLSELDAIFTLDDNKETALKAFLGGKGVFIYS